MSLRLYRNSGTSQESTNESPKMNRIRKMEVTECTQLDVKGFGVQSGLQRLCLKSILNASWVHFYAYGLHPNTVPISKLHEMTTCKRDH